MKKKVLTRSELEITQVEDVSIVKQLEIKTHSQILFYLVSC